MSTQKAHENERKHLASPHHPVFDRRALQVGRFVLAETGADDVILFGSRARGDYRDDSDIDLLLIHSCPNDHESRVKAKDSAKATAAVLYGSLVGVDLVWFSRKEFDQMRRSHNHVTAIAAQEGISMEGCPAGEEYRNDTEDFSGELDITEQRCYHARSHLRMLRRTVADEEIMLMAGQQAHQAIEHALKALISAAGQRYPHHHELLDLERVVRWADPEFSAAMESPLDALNDYGGGLKYDAPYAPLGDHDELLRRVEGDVLRIFQRVSALTGRDPWQDQR